MIHIINGYRHLSPHSYIGCHGGMGMLIVQKYGGTSLAGPERMLAAARRIVALAREDHHIVVVVSAQGDTTDRLAAQIYKINPEGSPREKDACLAVGEQLSAGLLALALEDLGIPAISLTGPQAGILTDRHYGNARILDIRTSRIRSELKKGHVVVVTGFQGADPEGNITTLGRGGSDTTAVALAAWLEADKCQIFTDVDGVYDKDPRRFPNARRFDRISYDHMLRLIEDGAQVLHDRSVLLAREKGISLEVLSAFEEKTGTLVEKSQGDGFPLSQIPSLE